MVSSDLCEEYILGREPQYYSQYCYVSLDLCEAYIPGWEPQYYSKYC